MSASRLVSSIVLLAFAPMALSVQACGGTGTNAASQVLKTPELPTDKQAKCKVAKSQSEPLIVEWPDAARGRLESMSRRGLVAVRYEGCELAVLPRCTVKEKKQYDYSPITRKDSKVVIKDADELYASMPVGAVKLEGKLASAGQLDVAMTIVGRYESSMQQVYKQDLEGDCSEATHVVAALTVGSFTFSAGSDAAVSGAASIGGAGGGAKSLAQRETLQHDGDETACTKASLADKTPPEGCGALLQIEVMPLSKGARPVAVAPVVIPKTTPTTPPVVEPTPEKIPEKVVTKPPPKCRTGMHAEDGVCVKNGTKPKPKPGTGTASGTIAAVTPTSCPTGQHISNGHCVEDEAPPKVEPKEPKTEPPPEPRAEPTCFAGSHLENGACVIDPYQAPQSSTPNAYSGAAPSEGAPNPWRGVLMYTAIGTGIAAIGFGYAALGSAKTAKDGCDDNAPTCSPDASDAAKRAKTFAIITDVAFGVTALAVIGIFLLPSKIKVSVAPTTRGVAAATWWNF